MGRGDYAVETNQKIRQRRLKARLKKKAEAKHKERQAARLGK